MRRLVRCVPCMAILLGLLCLGWTMQALAQPHGTAGPLADLSVEAVFAALMSAAFLVVGGYTARNDRDMREFRKAVSEQFRALTIEQRQQQTEINLLTERVLRDYPTKEEVKEWRAEWRESFNELKMLIRGDK